MPDRKKGTPSKAHQTNQHQHQHGKPPSASTPPGHNGGGNTAAVALANQDTALNPPFDARMRRMGSPLNQSAQIKRGWIQNEDGTQRVNFLFNPAAIDIGSTVQADVRNPNQASDEDVMNPDYVSTGSSTSLSLLYDRTYELFSLPSGSVTNPAYTFGAFSDIAAWYTYLKMLDQMPTTWTSTKFTSPMVMVPSYLFIGPNLFFYGFPNSITTTITHWNQAMIPMRAKVDIGFTILPRQAGLSVVKGEGSTNTAIPNPTNAISGWLGTIFGDGSTNATSNSDSDTPNTSPLFSPDDLGGG